MDFHLNLNLAPSGDVYLLWLAGALTFLMLFVGARLIAATTAGGGRFATFIEVMVGFVRENIVDEFLGHEGKKWFGFFAALFFFILFNNLLGKIPIPGFHSPTGNINVTFILAVMVFVVCQGVGLVKLGPVGYFKRKFMLPGAPLWVQPLAFIIMPIVLLAEPFSLAVRLFANMTAGHMVMLTFASAPMVGGVWLMGQPDLLAKLGAALPFTISVILVAFELFVALIQAFIFTLLSALYLSESLEEHH